MRLGGGSRVLLAASVAGALALSGAACGSEGDTPTGTRTSARGALRPGVGPNQPVTQVDPSSLPPPPAARRRRRRSATPPATPGATPGRAPAGGAGGAQGAPEDPEERLRRALAQAFGAPTNCISEQTRDGLDDELRVNVRVRVMGSGRVLSASVSGSGLSSEDRDCMRAHAEGLYLPGPIEDAPRSVATTVTYEVSDSRVTVSERGDAYTSWSPQGEAPSGERVLPGAQPAGSALPAAGTATDRPSGFVAPGSTLPATAEPGPAPGYVPPGSTLPAIAE